MVQSVPNRAEITGKIVSVSESPDVLGTLRVVVNVEKVGELPGFVNMFSWAEGKELALQVPLVGTATPALQAGDRLRCLIQKTNARRNDASPESIAVHHGS